MIGFRTISVVLLAFSAIGCGDNPRENDSTRDSESATGTPEAAANPRAGLGKGEAANAAVDVSKAEKEGPCQECVAEHCRTLGIQVGALSGKSQAKLGAKLFHITIPAPTELPRLSAELLTCVQTKCASKCAAGK